MPKNKRRNLLVCGQCSDLTNAGTVDANDGIFYCFICWEDFGGVPEDAKWINCILCKTAKPKELFSLTQQKKKKPICKECVPRRMADCWVKQKAMHTQIRTVNAMLMDGGGLVFTKTQSGIISRRDFLWDFSEKPLEILVGINNIQDGKIWHEKINKRKSQWVISVGDKQSCKKVSIPAGDKQWRSKKISSLSGLEEFLSFAFIDTIQIYSLQNVINKLSITFIFSPSTMYDVRLKYTFRKTQLFLSKVFDFPQKNLESIRWPAHIYLEEFLDCSEAVSNIILQFSGEVLLECTFRTAKLGKLFQAWDTWEADLGVMGDYSKIALVADVATVVTTTEMKGVDVEIDVDNPTNGSNEEAQIVDEVPEPSSHVKIDDKTEHTAIVEDSFEIVEAPI